MVGGEVTSGVPPSSQPPFPPPPQKKKAWQLLRNSSKGFEIAFIMKPNW